MRNLYCNVEALRKPVSYTHLGDEILIDVDEGVLELHVSDEEIAERYKTLEPVSYTHLYCKIAMSSKTLHFKNLQNC